jgi:hypothetical protein
MDLISSIVLRRVLNRIDSYTVDDLFQDFYQINQIASREMPLPVEQYPSFILCSGFLQLPLLSSHLDIDSPRILIRYS